MCILFAFVFIGIVIIVIVGFSLDDDFFEDHSRNHNLPDSYEYTRWKESIDYYLNKRNKK